MSFCNVFDIRAAFAQIERGCVIKLASLPDETRFEYENRVDDGEMDLTVNTYMEEGISELYEKIRITDVRSLSSTVQTSKRNPVARAKTSGFRRSIFDIEKPVYTPKMLTDVKRTSINKKPIFDRNADTNRGIELLKCKNTRSEYVSNNANAKTRPNSVDFDNADEINNNVILRGLASNNAEPAATSSDNDVNNANAETRPNSVDFDNADEINNNVFKSLDSNKAATESTSSYNVANNANTKTRPNTVNIVNIGDLFNIDILKSLSSNKAATETNGVILLKDNCVSSAAVANKDKENSNNTNLNIIKNCFETSTTLVARVDNIKHSSKSINSNETAKIGKIKIKSKQDLYIDPNNTEFLNNKNPVPFSINSNHIKNILKEKNVVKISDNILNCSQIIVKLLERGDRFYNTILVDQFRREFVKCATMAQETNYDIQYIVIEILIKSRHRDSSKKGNLDDIKHLLGYLLYYQISDFSNLFAADLFEKMFFDMEEVHCDPKTKRDIQFKSEYILILQNIKKYHRKKIKTTENSCVNISCNKKEVKKFNDMPYIGPSQQNASTKKPNKQQEFIYTASITPQECAASNQKNNPAQTTAQSKPNCSNQNSISYLNVNNSSNSSSNPLDDSVLQDITKQYPNISPAIEIIRVDNANSKNNLNLEKPAVSQSVIIKRQIQKQKSLSPDGNSQITSTLQQAANQKINNSHQHNIQQQNINDLSRENFTTQQPINQQIQQKSANLSKQKITNSSLSRRYHPYKPKLSTAAQKTREMTHADPGQSPTATSYQSVIVNNLTRLDNNLQQKEQFSGLENCPKQVFAPAVALSNNQGQYSAKYYNSAISAGNDNYITQNNVCASTPQVHNQQLPANNLQRLAYNEVCGTVPCYGHFTNANNLSSQENYMYQLNSLATSQAPVFTYPKNSTANYMNQQTNFYPRDSPHCQFIPMRNTVQVHNSQSPHCQFIPMQNTVQVHNSQSPHCQFIPMQNTVQVHNSQSPHCQFIPRGNTVQVHNGQSNFNQQYSAKPNNVAKQFSAISHPTLQSILNTPPEYNDYVSQHNFYPAMSQDVSQKIYENNIPRSGTTPYSFTNANNLYNQKNYEGPNSSFSSQALAVAYPSNSTTNSTNQQTDFYPQYSPPCQFHPMTDAAEVFNNQSNFNQSYAQNAHNVPTNSQFIFHENTPQRYIPSSTQINVAVTRIEQVSVVTSSEKPISVNHVHSTLSPTGSQPPTPVMADHIKSRNGDQPISVSIVQSSSSPSLEDAMMIDTGGNIKYVVPDQNKSDNDVLELRTDVLLRDFYEIVEKTKNSDYSSAS